MPPQILAQANCGPAQVEVCQYGTEITGSILSHIHSVVISRPFDPESNQQQPQQQPQQHPNLLGRVRRILHLGGDDN